MTILAELDHEMHDKILLTAEFRYKDLIKSIPGARFKNASHGDAWRVPLTWQTCLALRTSFGEQLVIGPQLADWATDYRHTAIDPALALRSKTAETIDGYTFLYPFQAAGAKFLATTRRALLSDGLGSGKSRTALGAVRYAYEHLGKNPFPVLIVAPNSTLYSWQREIDQVWPGLTSVVVKGTATARRKLLKEQAHVYIINWEAVRGHSRLAPYGSISIKKCAACGGADEAVTDRACQHHLRELNEIDFNTVIMDECHRAKDPASQQTRAVKAATGSADFRFALSNTPIGSTPDELWSVLNWLMPEAYPSRTAYVDRFLDLSYNAWGQAVVTGVKEHMKPEFFAGIDPHLRHMPKEVVLPFLPPVVRERREVEMAPKQKKAYEQMRDAMLAELDDNELMIATSPLTRMSRMLQFASSYAELVSREVVVHGDDGQPTTITKKFALLADPSCKLDAFMDDLPDYGDESLVVFAASRQLVELLSGRLTKAKIKHGLITGAQNVDDRQEHMDDFQAGRTKLILCTIAAGGTGITLTAGSTAVFLQRSWSMIDNVQAEGRVHRIGSQVHDRIKIIDYVTIGTVEQAVHEAIEMKTEQLEVILRSRDLIRQVLTNNTAGSVTASYDLPASRADEELGASE